MATIAMDSKETMEYEALLQSAVEMGYMQRVIEHQVEQLSYFIQENKLDSLKLLQGANFDQPLACK